MTNYLKWFERAKYDLSCAEEMLKSKKFLYVSFMCHQTLEKSIKAYFLKTKQQQPPYIHNLERLLKEAELTTLVSKSQNDFIGSMNPYYISSRYPDDIDDLMDLCNDELASQQLKLTKDFILWLEQKMK